MGSDIATQIEKLAMALHARVEWEREMFATGYPVARVETDASTVSMPFKPGHQISSSKSPSLATDNLVPVRTASQVPCRDSSAAHDEASLPPGAPHGTSLARLKATLTQCQRCGLHTHRTHVVFGEGPPGAPLTFVGAAPSQEEDMLDLPFMGETGTLLNKIMGAMGVSRDTVYLTTMVKCLPPSNRKPTQGEVETCGHFLMQQLECVSPRIVIALGEEVAAYLLDTRSPFPRLHGTFQRVRGLTVVPVYSLTDMMSSPKLKRPVWDAMKEVKRQLESH